MINFLDNIAYIHPSIGYFPIFETKLINGFSWGKNSKNMQFNLGEFLEVRNNVQKYFDELEIGNFRDSLLMLPEHKENIIFVDENLLNATKSTKFGKCIKCDAAFTSMEGIPITVKPADCTTAVIYAESCDGKAITGLVHSGRRSVELSLPSKSISELCKRYNVNTDKIIIGIVPHLFKENHKFQHLSDVDTDFWKEYIIADKQEFQIAETEYAIDQYIKSGVLEDNIYVYNIDTYDSTENEEGFSFKYHFEMERLGKTVRNGRFIVSTSILKT